MMRIVFLKSTRLPRLSVRIPSSSTLQQDIKDVGMRFFNLIEEDHRVRFPPDFLCQLPPFLISHIPGGAPTSRETANFSMYSLMSIR